jgi:hypothetical protein
MRACFLKNNVCALGYGFAIIQTPKAENEGDEATVPKPIQPPAAVPMDLPAFDVKPGPAGKSR